MPQLSSLSRARCCEGQKGVTRRHREVLSLWQASAYLHHPGLLHFGLPFVSLQGRPCQSVIAKQELHYETHWGRADSKAAPAPVPCPCKTLSPFSVLSCFFHALSKKK